MLWVNRIYLGFRGDGLPDRKVRELRIRAGKTQKEIADYLNISRSTYTLYESAKRQMSNETLCALAEYYGVSTDYLLGRTDISSPPGLYTPQSRSGPTAKKNKGVSHLRIRFMEACNKT